MLSAFAVHAQVPAPDFLCTRSEAGQEILTWENVSVDCGNYVATEIYRAAAPDGPYTLLVSLPDSTQTEYLDPNPNGEQLFYFLRYVYDCPGATVRTSDTLDNFVPQPPTPKFVSVVDGDLEIHWRPSPSPEVNRYVVFDVTDNQVIPLDTVGLDTVYTVTGVPSDELTSRAYRLTALDACGNDSPLNEGTISAFDLIGRGGVGCQSEIQLIPLQQELLTVTEFRPRQGDTVSLFVSVNGGGYTLHDSWTIEDVTDTSQLYTYEAANDGDSLCFYFQINYAEIAPSQRTVVYCQVANISQPVRDFDLFGAEIQDNGELRFGYQDDVVQADNYSVALEVAGPGDTTSYSPGVALFPGEELITDGAVPITPGNSLRFVLTDSCGRTATTNYASPVWLEVQNDASGETTLNWTPPHDLPGAVFYTVLRINDDSTTTELATGIPGLTYTDPLPDPGQLCYRIQANYTPPAADTTYTFLSNVQCVVEAVEIYFPNVFSPDALQDANRAFRPFFNTPAGLEAYQLRIFNRWGALVFESEDPTAGWDGTVDGRGVPIGTYVYNLQYTPVGKFARQLTGTVHLIR
ncbi:gliding motility-associated-like protein [Neolewinella xylanilytica]|uniref:Gliding motility-associated-like protein n=2 Tax=Neolewinella xylanilytica TaxID=1514080 RepID=A0A2S6I2W4_9BACT|nr:gliding motility-associated-like protein [Neolewinella xylanilytica]